jgi:dihydroorotase
MILEIINVNAKRNKKRKMDLLLKNCKILKNDNLILMNILISENKIQKITCDMIEGDHDTIDCYGNVVIPGLIDVHVHFREPGMEHKEDFLTGSYAASAGGITTILDMPNTKPPTFTIEALEQKRELAKKSIVNYGFYFGVSANGNTEEIKKAVELGDIAGLKIYMNDTTGNLLVTNNELLEEIFEKAKTVNKVVAVHAEGEILEKAVKLAKRYENKLYLCHVSTKNEIDFIRTNQSEHIFVEVTPHHLFLSDKEDDNPFTKMLPSLKSYEDQQALWGAIKEGVVSTIGTDHAPHLYEEKNGENIPFGVPGCETMLPLLLNAINQGKLSLAKLQELCCHNPANIFGMKNKGQIKEGYDADLVIIDLNMERKIENDKLFTKCKWSPFDGEKLKGWPTMTIVNGNIVYDYNNGNPLLNKDYKGKEVEYNV